MAGKTEASVNASKAGAATATAKRTRPARSGSAATGKTAELAARKAELAAKAAKLTAEAEAREARRNGGSVAAKAEADLLAGVGTVSVTPRRGGRTTVRRLDGSPANAEETERALGTPLRTRRAASPAVAVTDAPEAPEPRESKRATAKREAEEAASRVTRTRPTRRAPEPEPEPEPEAPEYADANGDALTVGASVFYAKTDAYGEVVSAGIGKAGDRVGVRFDGDAKRTTYAILPGALELAEDEDEDETEPEPPARVSSSRATATRSAAPAKAPASGRNVAKAALFRAALDALANVVAELPDDSPVFVSYDEDEAGQAIANAVHHFAAGRDADGSRYWPDGLPLPDRSEWR